MADQHPHTFHIPVLGLAFSIDTPIKVARFGISSVMSLVDDVLIEHMRKYHSTRHGIPYIAITPNEDDYRARRITAYLNLVHDIVQKQMAVLKASAFERGSEIVKYFELLADRSPLKALYHRMLHTDDPALRATLEHELRSQIVPGAIDVNIMTKLDKMNTDASTKEILPSEYSDALAALRGFAQSDLRSSSVVLSAGLNLRLFTYIGKCSEFHPDARGTYQKKVILKVSDYRSGLIQGKMLAKKGVWISEFRIESGLNCGGHAFATDGYLLGPILEEFKMHRHQLVSDLFQLYAAALGEQGITVPAAIPETRITVQGGIGTATEDRFLQEYYGVEGTGWGSPFLLVPEATNLDDATREQLADAGRDKYYLSDASPLGIAFNNIRDSASHGLLHRRAEQGLPGSPCVKKFLVTNTEFTEKPICLASRQYQSFKINQLKSLNLPPEELEQCIEKVIEKQCLCEDLSACAPAVEGENGSDAEEKCAVAVCPGPNLAYFTKISTLEEMVGHIYGRIQLISVERPHMFITELEMYVDYFKKAVQRCLTSSTANDQKYLTTFWTNLRSGITYYKALMPQLCEESERYRDAMMEQLLAYEEELDAIVIPA